MATSIPFNVYDFFLNGVDCYLCSNTVTKNGYIVEREIKLAKRYHSAFAFDDVHVETFQQMDEHLSDHDQVCTSMYMSPIIMKQ